MGRLVPTSPPLHLLSSQTSFSPSMLSALQLLVLVGRRLRQAMGHNPHAYKVRGAFLS